MVGGLGERYTRVAAAHTPVHNGLTVLPQTEKYLHGTKVAYGIRSRAPCSARTTCWRSWCRRTGAVNLPTTLAALEVDINSRGQLDR